MRQKLFVILSALVMASLTFTTAFAGTIHFRGSTSFSLGSLHVDKGAVIGLQNAGVKSGFILAIGHGHCGGGDDDDRGTTNEPPTPARFDFTNPSNNLTFPQLNIENPRCGDGNDDDDDDTWVWTGATLEVWQTGGGQPLATKDFTCFVKKNGDFDCR